MTNVVIGIVGKPSSGKSTFLNAICNTDVKMASYPFTTLEPNLGVTHYRTKCFCSTEQGKQGSYKCETHYDKCIDGFRYIPIKIIDVPGLIPGASKGKGLGNKFLDAIRKAHVLVHILDASGSTDERGETIKGSFYDCSKDVKWILEEIIDWIFGNLFGRWERIMKVYKLKKLSIEDLFLKYLGGYSTNRRMLRNYLSKMKIESKEFFLRNYFENISGSLAENEFVENESKSEKEKEEFLKQEKFSLELWKKEHVKDFVKKFVELRFPLVLVLNKVDLKGSQQNIMNIYRNYPNLPGQSASSLAELALKKMNEKGIINYTCGSSHFEILQSDLDPASKKMLKRIKKKVLDEFGSTGLLDAIKLAIDQINPVTVFPIYHKSPSSSGSDGFGKKKVVGDCLILEKTTTIDEVLEYLDTSFVQPPLKCERLDGRELSGNDTIEENNIIVFRHCSQF